MKIAVLTTATLHHAQFLAKLTEQFKVAKIFTETGQLSAPFETHHEFEKQRDDFELREWFSGKAPQLADFAEEQTFESVNLPECHEALKKCAADVVVVFGTGRIRAETIEACGKRIINLHGGDPERYRGLDTHLWAIYHNDFGGLSTTLHHVNPVLDDGQIIANLPLQIRFGMELHELRMSNTAVCIRLVVDCLAQFETNGEIVARPQSKKGRYYSFMPAALKDICCKKFRRYTSTL